MCRARSERVRGLRAIGREPLPTTRTRVRRQEVVRLPPHAWPTWQGRRGLPGDRGSRDRARRLRRSDRRARRRSYRHDEPFRDRFPVGHAEMEIVGRGRIQRNAVERLLPIREAVAGRVLVGYLLEQGALGRRLGDTRSPCSLSKEVCACNRRNREYSCCHRTPLSIDECHVKTSISARRMQARIYI